VAVSRFTFWCPACHCKRVVGLNVAMLHNIHVEEGKRYVCYNCEEMFNLEELATYGNNINRVIRQKRMNLHEFSPKMPIEAGASQW